MAQFKIKWSFINTKQAIKAIDLLGVKSLDKINFYKNNKRIDKIHYGWTDSYTANKKAKKDIRKFFKENSRTNDFIEIIKN
jgi:hypothetical protein